MVKMDGQRDKLHKSLDDPIPSSSVSRSDQKNMEKQLVVAYQDAPVILQVGDKGNQKNQPFFITLLTNKFHLQNCMLDSGATSNVMPKKVMEQLNLRISRPYHNMCAMDSKKMEVCGLIKDL